MRIVAENRGQLRSQFSLMFEAQRTKGPGKGGTHQSALRGDSSTKQEERKVVENNRNALPGDTANGILNGIAWLNLALGVTAGVAILVNFGSVEVGDYGRTVANPFGIGLGLAFLFEAVVVTGVLFVLSGIGANAVAIRKALQDWPHGEQKSGSTSAQLQSKQRTNFDPEVEAEFAAIRVQAEKLTSR